MAKQAPETAVAPARFEGTLTTDAKFAGRLAAATLRYHLLRPRPLITIALVPLILLVLVPTIALRAGNDAPLSDIGLALLVFLAVYTLVVVKAYFLAKERISDRLPVGSEYSISMSDDSIRMKDSLVTTDISYKLYRSVRSTKDLVALYPRRGRVPLLVPSELFTSESLKWLSSRLSTTR